MYIADYDFGSSNYVLYRASTSNFSSAIPTSPTSVSSLTTLPSAQNGIIADSSGNLYIGTPTGVDKYSGGSLTTITSSLGSTAGVGVDSAGNLYSAGTDTSGNQVVLQSGGTVVNFGSVNVGSSSSTISLPFTIGASSSTTVTSIQVLTMGATGLDFTDAGGSTCTATTYASSTGCVVKVKFSPKHPGQRLGAVVFYNGSAVLSTVNMYGTGTGPQIAYESAAAIAINPTVSSTGLNESLGEAVDAAGNLFIADSSNNRIVKVPAGGGTATSITPSVGGQSISTPAGVAVDGAGSLFIADFGNNRIVEVPPGGGAAIAITPTGSVGALNSPDDVAVDATGDLFICDDFKNRVVEIPAGGGSAIAISPTVNGLGLSQPGGIAVDTTGNLYIADTNHNRIVKVPAGSGAATAIDPTVNGLQLSCPAKVALDAAGDLFIADFLNSRVIEIPAGGAPIAFDPTVSSKGIKYAQDVALDGAGDLFVLDYINSPVGTRILEIQRSQAPSLSFATTNVGSTSTDSPQSATVENTGNSTLTLKPPSTGYNPSVATNWLWNSASTCTQTGTSSSTAYTLASGASTSTVSESTVEFLSDSSTIAGCGSQAVSNGTATCATALAAGNHSVVAVFAGDSNFSTSTSNTVTETVNSAVTATQAIASAVLTQNHAAIVFTPVTGSGGTAPLVYSISPALPSGLSMSSSTGSVSGTPTAASVATTYTVTVTDTNSKTASNTFTLTVNTAVTATQSVSSATLTQNHAITAFTPVTGSGGTGSLIYSISPTLPAGLSINSGTGAISGTPTVPSAASSYTVTVTDSNGATASNSFMLTINPAAAATNVVVSGYPTAVYANALNTGTVTVLDQYGSTYTSYSGSANVITSENATAIPVTITNGVGTFSLSFATAASNQSITASINTLTSTPETGITVNLAPGYVVETTADDASGVASNCPAGGGGTTCTLRDALAAAAATGTGNITFAPTVFATAQTITLSNGTLNIPSNTTINGATSGSGATLTNLVTVGGGGASSNFSVFTVGSGVIAASISNLTIANGNATGNGGGILNSGTLSISSSTLRGNSACNGGGIYNSGTLTVTGSTLASNYGAGYATNCGNGGGGIDNASGTLTISDSTFAGNNSAPGGAILADNGTITVANSTFYGNSAIAEKVGGAIFINNATVTVSGSVFSGNSAAGGGAIYSYGTLTVSGSVLGGDTGGECTSNGSGACPTNRVNGNLVSVSNIDLAALGNYGGPTQTLIPLPGSAAICAGSSSLVPSGTTTDQRGVAFNAGGYCPAGSVDAGAVQSSYALKYVQQPTTVVQNAAMTPAPTVELDESGVPFTGSAVTIPLTLTTGTGTVTGGSAATSTTTGIATYPALSIDTVGTGDVLTASFTLSGGASSLSVAGNAFNVTPAVTQLAFSTVPLATVTAGGNAGAAITVSEENVSGTLVTTASDSITLTVTGPNSYSKTYTQPATAGVASFDLSGVALTAAGGYSYSAAITGNATVTAATASETVTSASAATVSVVSGSGQSVVIGTAFAAPLDVKVVDQYNNPVPNASVAFMAPGSGASATFIGAPATTSADGTATVTATANGLASGTAYTVTASVSGATTSASFLLTNTQKATTLTVAPSSAALAYGQPVTVNAAISPASVLSSTPTGTVTFYDGTTMLTPASPVAGAAASYTVSVPTVGNHIYAAQYAGDTNFQQSAQTSATLSGPASPVTLTYGTGGTISVNVAGQYSGTGIATPSGTVSYTIGTGAPQTAAITAGTATLTIPTTQAAGNYTVSVSYAGDGNYNAATAINVPLTIKQANATINVTPYSVTYDATAHTATGTATGVGGTNLAADLTLTASTHTAAGTYAADVWSFHDATGNYADASGSVSDVIRQAAATINVTPYSVTYDATAHTATGTATGVGSANLAADLTLTGTTHTAAGTYATDAWTFHDATGNYADANGMVSDAIAQATLTLAANNATKVYGTANPAFSGSISGQQSGDTFTESFSTAATLSSPVGSYAIVPAAAGANLADYTVAITNGTLSVTKANTTTALKLSSTSITPGQSLTLSAQVVSVTTGTPSGAVSFYDGTTLISSVALSGGAASYTTAALAPGLTHSLTAVYSGDVNFNSSATAASGSTSVTVAPLDFTMTIAGPASGTVVPGSSISYKVTVTPDYGSYAGTVNFAVAGLPPGATVSFSPSTIAANGGPQTITVTIQTAPATAAEHAPPQPWPGGGAPLTLAALLLLGLGSVRKRGKAMRRLMCVALLMLGGAAALVTTGCGGHAGFFNQAPKNYTVTTTATAGNLTHSASFNLNLQ